MPTMAGPVTPVLHLGGVAAKVVVASPTALLEADDPPYVPSGRDTIDVQVMVLDRYRNPIAELRPVVVKPVRFNRRGFNSGTVVWPSDAQGGDALVDIDRDRFQDRARELQVWRDGRVVAGGPVMRHTRDSTGMIETTFTDHRQYLADRTVGSAERTNWLRNPNAVDGLAWWTGVNVTRTVVPTLLGPEPYATRLTGSDPDASDYQIRHMPTSDDAGGNNVTAVAWYKLASDVDFPAFGNGLELRVFVGGALTSSTITPIETRGPWTRLSVTAHQPPNVSVEVEVRRWAPNGAAILWTGCQLVYRENISVGAGGDATELVAAVLRTCSAEGDHDWELSSTLSGETFEDGMAYNDYEAPNMGDAVADWEHVVDCYPTIPSRHRVRWEVGPPPSTATFALPEEMLAGLRVTQDASEMASYVRFRGDSDGVAREEGAAFDSGVADGLRIDKVETAPDGTPTRNLDSGAKKTLALYHRAALHVEASAAHDGYLRTSGEWVHRVRPGDVFTVEAPIAGNVTAEVSQRIEAMEWDPGTDVVTFTDLSEVVS